MPELPLAGQLMMTETPPSLGEVCWSTGLLLAHQSTRSAGSSFGLLGLLLVFCRSTADLLALQLAYWSTAGQLVCWLTGLLLDWFTGLLVCCNSTGLLIYWSTGLLLC